MSSSFSTGRTYPLCCASSLAEDGNPLEDFTVFSVQDAQASTARPFCFSVKNEKNEVMFIEAKTDAEFSSWVHALRLVSTENQVLFTMFERDISSSSKAFLTEDSCGCEQELTSGCVCTALLKARALFVPKRAKSGWICTEVDSCRDSPSLRQRSTRCFRFR